MPIATNRRALLAWALLAGLLAFRLPSLVEPAGADQALYTYVGQRILAGEVPYRDAWDQKPPGVHLAYAALVAIWPHESVVAGADLAIAALTALLLVGLGRRLSGSTATGVAAAAIFLLLGNPALGRLSGVRVRAQCEVFIALAVALALAAAWRAAHAPGSRRAWLLVAGALVGLGAVLKYNAAVYGLPVGFMAAMPAEGEPRISSAEVVRRTAWMAAGAAVPVAMTVAWMAGAGALDDLYEATIVYNLRYSGETYASHLGMLTYLLTFPVRFARVDALWFAGGLGSAVLALGPAWRDRRLAVAPLWVATACLAIAINGSRGLPQYFVQAGPALALAAGLAGGWAWPRVGRAGGILLSLVLVVAIARIASFPKLVDNTAYDLQYMRGELSRREYLARFGNPDSGDKYSALAVAELASLLRERTAPSDRVLVFGFSPWAYVGSGRASASRFFWSRPVIIGFLADRPGYGVSGLLRELAAQPPRLVVLQDRDWDPDGPNSSDFFLADAQLSSWLESRYVPAGRLHNFRIWMRRERQ